MNIETKRPVKEAPTLSIFLKRMRNGFIRSDAEVQRLADQWDREAEARLIETVLTNDYIPPLVLANIPVGDTKNTDTYILDGLQRSTTLLKFRYGNMKITKDIDIPYKKISVDPDGNRNTEWLVFNLKNKRYDNLPEELRDEFESYQIETVTYENCTHDKANMLIRRLNINKSMSTNQKAFTYQGKVAGQIREIINDTHFFEDSEGFTDGMIKNGTVERTVWESYTTVFDRENWKQNTFDMAKHVNETATEEGFWRLKELFSELDETCSEFNEYFNPKNTPVFISVYNECKESGHDKTDFYNFLCEFENLSEVVVDETSWSILNEDRSTKSKSLILSKIKLVVKLMEEYFNRVPQLKFVS